MSAPRKNSKRNPENTSVDWAEKLKASMNQGYAESDTDTDHTDDDLAALLRAQLGKSTETASLLDSLDTSDFEEEFEDEFEEELEEELEEEFEEELEGEFEEELEEELEEAFEEELDRKSTRLNSSHD